MRIVFDALSSPTSAVPVVAFRVVASRTCAGFTISPTIYHSNLLLLLQRSPHRCDVIDLPPGKVESNLERQFPCTSAMQTLSRICLSNSGFSPRPPTVIASTGNLLSPISSSSCGQAFFNLTPAHNV